MSARGSKFEASRFEFGPSVAAPGLPVPALAAGGDAADLLVRRDPVLRLPALAVVRPRPVVRERVPVFLRSRDRASPTGFTRRFSSGRPTPAGGSTSARSAARSCGRRSISPATWSRARPARRWTAFRSRTSRPSPMAPRCTDSWRSCWRSCARSASGSAASCRRLAVWLGTPLLFYMYVAPPFSHACSAFARGAVHLRLAAGPRRLAGPRHDRARRRRRADGDGARAGRVLRRGPALDFVGSLGRVGIGDGDRRSEVGRPRSLATARLAGCRRRSSAVYTPQAATYMILNGHLGPHASVSHKMNWMAPHALEVLFSPEHGFFVWTPLALVAIAGLVWAGRRAGLSATRRVCASACC